MATSGDYRNYYEAEGRTHLPHHRSANRLPDHSQRRLGQRHRAPLRASRRLRHRPAGARTQEGFDLAEELGLAAYFLQRDKEGVFVGRMTTAFKDRSSKPGIAD